MRINSPSRPNGIDCSTNRISYANLLINAGILALTVRLINLSTQNLHNTMRSADNTSKQVKLLEEISNKL